MKLSVRYIVAFVSLVMIACVTVAVSVVVSNLGHQATILQQHGVVFANLVSELAEDDPNLNLETVINDRSQVYGAALYDGDFNLIASYEVPNSPVPLPTVEELETLRAVSTATGAPAAEFRDTTMTALSTIDGPGNKSAVVLLSTRTALDNIASSVQFAMLATLVCAVLAGMVAFVIARRITGPVQALRKATRDLEERQFDPDTLSKASRRSDEIGELARSFTAMAQEVQQRERERDKELQALQVKIDQGERARTVADITGSASFVELEQRAAALRRRRATQEASDQPTDQPDKGTGE